MTFVDTNVFIYAVGRAHSLRQEAREFFLGSRRSGEALITSAEVLQELMHVYLSTGRTETLDAALALATQVTDDVVDVAAENVLHARELADHYPALTARDLLHLAVCRQRSIPRIKTFDRALASAFGA